MKFNALEICSIKSIPVSNMGIIEIDVLMTDGMCIELMQAICERIGDDVFFNEAKKIAQII